MRWLIASERKYPWRLVFALVPHLCIKCWNEVWLERVWKTKKWYDSHFGGGFSHHFYCLQCSPTQPTEEPQ